MLERSQTRYHFVYGRALMGMPGLKAPVAVGLATAEATDDVAALARTEIGVGSGAPAKSAKSGGVVVSAWI